MIKLQAAKCPQCGADIEVNESLEKTICQYCGTTILVQDAVQKYKLELSGNVKVAGIKNRDDFLEQAKKHFKVEEYLDAKECLNEIIKEDSFDIEAYSELLKNDAMLLKNGNYNLKISNCNDNYSKVGNRYYEEFVQTYDRLKKIDDKNTREKYLKGYEEEIKWLEELRKELDDTKEKNAKIVEELNKDFELIKKYGYYQEYRNVMHESFKCAKCIDSVTYAKVKGSADSYSLIDYAELTIDGILFGNYRKQSFHYVANPDNMKIYTVESVPTENFEEIDERFAKYKEKIGSIIEKEKSKREKQDVKDERYRKRHLLLNELSFALGITALVILIGLHALSYLSYGIGGAIGFAVIFDSWLPNIIFNWINSAKYNISSYKKKD